MQAYQTSGTARAPGPGPESRQLRLSARERRGLVWLKQWARGQITWAKRRLKYSPRKTAFDTEEVEQLQALVDIERAAGRLLGESG